MIKGSKACQHHKLALWWGQGFIPAIKLGMKTVWVRQGYAVYHRLNDNEDKWIVSLNGETIPAEDTSVFRNSILWGSCIHYDT